LDKRQRTSRAAICLLAATRSRRYGDRPTLPVGDMTLRVKYTLAELLVGSDFDKPLTDEEREWIDAPAAGRELV
jgi:hypothetical protein